MKHWFTQEASLLVRATSTGWGGETAWATASTNPAILCRINPVGGMERYAGDRHTVFATHKLYCSATEEITVNNRVEYAGDTYGVVFVKNTLGLNHHKTVYLKEPV